MTLSPSGVLSKSGPVLAGCQADARLKLSAEGTLVVEAVFHGDGANRGIGALQLLAGTVDPKLEQVLNRRGLKQGSESSLKLAGGEVHHGGDALDGDALVEMAVEVIHSGLEILVRTDDGTRAAGIPHDSGDADDPPRSVMQRSLAAQVADQDAFAIGHEPNLVSDGYVLVSNPAVLPTDLPWFGCLIGCNHSLACATQKLFVIPSTTETGLTSYH